MKIYKVFFAAFFLVALITSCKKNTTDDSDKFIGTWTGTIHLIVPGMNANTSKAESLTITIGSASASQIILTQAGSIIVPTGKVSGGSYTYDEYTTTATEQGVTVSAKLNGTGSLSGNVITETGTIVYTMQGIVYPGTWSSSLTKQ
jgi:hypothetical protein